MLTFSVIVPVYNTESYLEECIASVLEQTYAQYELILIDDGSTDLSGQLCDQYARLYRDKIIVVHTANRGPMHSRAHGILMARGNILMFLDSDDTLRLDALELLSSFFQNYNCDMVLFNAGESPMYPSKTLTHPFDDNEIFEGDAKKTIYRKLVESRILNSICLKAVKRECTQIPDLFLHCDKVKHGEDLLLSAHLITASSRIGYLNQGIYHYRIRSGSITQSFDMGLKDSLKVVHNLLDQLIEKWDVPELKYVHNSRKISGWMDTLVFLLQNRHAMSESDFWHQLHSMATDPYFIRSYQNIDPSYLSTYYQWMALSLLKERYEILIWTGWAKNIVSKLIHRIIKK